MTSKTLRGLLAAACAGAWCAAAHSAEVNRSALAAALLAAYPAAIKSVEGDTIRWRDGSTMPVGEVRDMARLPDMLNRGGSIAEQFLFAYPFGPQTTPVPQGEDAGRIRNEAFFRKLYGNCRRGEVQRRLRTVTWLPKTAPQRIQLTTVNGVDQIVVRISADIEALAPALRRTATRLSGTFACRPILGSRTVESAHGYGIAIDLNARLGRYWRWSGLSPRAWHAGKLPPELVEVFERHGFIWGGKWHHFDTFHFEYRPELIDYARRLQQAQ